tara:strand:+ start:268 stop:858 length:591 start_codon:yes stop_codon:yes gene_type:complete
MISLFTKNNPISEEKNSLLITYPRTVNIIFGNYPYPDIIHNLIMAVKSNLDPNMKNYTNIEGGMTSWDYFLDKPDFVNFITYLINKHQLTHPEIFKHFLEKRTIKEAWGTEIKKGDKIRYHTHPNSNGILYLTKGSDLICPELNLKITPEPGDYYIFPPQILHGFNASSEEKNRYSLVFNFAEYKYFDYNRKLNNE